MAKNHIVIDGVKYPKTWDWSKDYESHFRASHRKLQFDQEVVAIRYAEYLAERRGIKVAGLVPSVRRDGKNRIKAVVFGRKESDLRQIGRRRGYVQEFVTYETIEIPHWDHEVSVSEVG